MTREEIIKALATGEPRRVVYSPPGGPREVGVLTSLGHIYAYVRYGSDGHSKATHPDEIELETS